MDSIWQITGTDARSGQPVRSELLASSEAEARTMAAAIHISVTAVEEVERSLAPSTPQRYCPRCGTIAAPAARYQGSGTVSRLLLFLFFPAVIPYELWRHAARQWICSNCGRAGMLPADAAPKQIPTAEG